jgi:hypothetical protein
MVCFFAGDCFTVPAGFWYSIGSAGPPCAILSVKWMTWKSGVQTLHSIVKMHKAGKDDSRMRAFIPMDYKLVPEWADFILEATNRLLGAFVNHPFTWETGSGGGVDAKAYGPVEVKETLGQRKERFDAISDLSALAEEFSTYKPPQNLRVRELPQRRWGRLTNFVKAAVGIATTQLERDEQRGGRPPASP